MRQCLVRALYRVEPTLFLRVAALRTRGKPNGRFRLAHALPRVKVFVAKRQPNVEIGPSYR